MTSTKRPFTEHTQFELEIINQFAADMLQARNLDDLLWSIAENVGKLLAFENFVIYLSEHDRLYQRAAFGIKNPTTRKIKNPIVIELGSGIVGTVAKTGRAELLTDESNDPRYIADEVKGRSKLTVAVVYQESVLGVFDAESAQPGKFSEADLRVLQTLANMSAPRIAFTLAEAQRNEPKDTHHAEQAIYRLLAENATDVIWTSALDSRLTYISPSIERLTGYTAEEAVVLQLDEFYSPATVKIVEAAIQAEFDAETSGDSEPERKLTWELQLRCKNGSLVWTETTVSFIRDESGSVTGFLGVVRDKNEHKELEEALQLSEQSFRQLIEQSPDMISALDGQRFLYVNQAMLDALGYQRDEFLDLPLESVLHPDEMRVYATRKSMVEQGGKPPSEIMRCRRKDGSIVLVEVHAYTTTFDGQQARIVIGRDVTQHRADEEALRHSEAQYRTLIEELPDPVVIIQEGRIFFMNQAALDLFGYEWEEAKNIPAKDYIHPEDHEAYTRRQETFDRDGKLPAAEARFVKSDGSIVIAETMAQPVTIGGQKMRVVIIRDITLRRQAEEMQQQLSEHLERRVQERTAQLEKSEQRLSQMLDIAQDAIISVDENQLVTLFNKGAEEIFGFKEHEVIGRSLDKLLPVKTQIHHWKYIQEFSKTPDTSRRMNQRGEIQGRRKSGEHFPAEASISKINVDGETVLTAFVRDVTEQKQAETLLQQSELKFRDLVETSHDMISTASVEGYFSYVNPAWQRVLGYSEEELVGRHYAEFKDPENIDPQAGSNSVFTNELINHERVYLSKSGQRHILSFNAKPIYDIDGELVGVQGTGRDVTQQQEIERALRESETKFRDFVETSQDLIWRIDANACITYLNPACIKIFGYTPEEMLGNPVTDYQESALNRSIEFFREFFAREDMLTEEVKCVAKGGKKIILQVYSKPICDPDGEIIGLQGTAHDVTNSRIIEEQLRQAQKMQALGTLAGGVAHDFNNILAPILGYSELLVGDSENQATTNTYAEAIFQSAHRAKDLVAQILLFSRRSQSSKEAVNICPVLTEVFALFRSTLPKTISVDNNMSIESAIVYCDFTQIHQVLMNLCVNAAQAVQNAGHISISLDTVELENFKCVIGKLLSGSYVRLTVTDDGAGIDRETIERIFEPFFSTKAPGKGTGLGLSTVFGIVHDHQGGISVTSKPGAGSTFGIYLPLTKLEAKQVSTGQNPQNLKGSENILFVDDEISITTLAEDSLSRFGYNVVTATSGHAALKIFHENPDQFDVVVTDQTMPNMTGEIFTQELLGIKPDIPVILCTGHSRSVTPDNSQHKGIRKFLYKPIKPTTLAQEIRGVLDSSADT